MGRGSGNQEAVNSVVARQEPFIEAWKDLRVRLNNGITQLGVTQLRASQSKKSDAEEQRLAAKAEALEGALAIYESLNDNLPDDGDHAAAWRLFTDAIKSNYDKAADSASKSGAASLSVTNAVMTSRLIFRPISLPMLNEPVRKS